MKREPGQLNIYGMYTANGERAGFWVRRYSWRNVWAFVVKVAGQTEGPLPGEPPYHGNPGVLAYFWRLESYETFPMNQGLDAIKCPGGYGYGRCVPPWVSGDAEVSYATDGSVPDASQIQKLVESLTP